MPASKTESETVSGLLCAIEGLRILVPEANVDQVIEYPIVRSLPLAHRGVGGIALHADAVLISLALSEKTGAQTKGVRLVTEGEARWVLEVSTVSGFRTVTFTSKAPPKSVPPGWLRAAKDDNGNDVMVFDVRAVLKEFA